MKTMEKTGLQGMIGKKMFGKKLPKAAMKKKMAKKEAETEED